jgi:FkbM family methyltransferase
MTNIHGVWLPDHEQHLVTEFAKGPGWTYQKHKLDMAMEHCIPRRLAIDIGGQCGLWSMHLTKLFDEVVAFEPKMEHRECYTMNVQGNYTLHPYGLGNRDFRANIHTTEGSSGDSWVEPGDDVEIRTLDSFNLVPDFIKIDTEGFEYFIIQGGEQTIKTHKPVMVVEQKKGKGSTFGLKDDDAITLLKEWGYVVQKVISGDYILTCTSS